MAQLLVRHLDEQLVRKLKAQAGQHGISAEEEHRRLLREALTGRARGRPFKEYLLQMPELGSKARFERDQGLDREVGI